MEKSVVLFFIVISCLGLVSAVSISTASYSVDSSSLGSAGGEVSTSNFEARTTNVYDGAGTRNVTSSSYSANSGWFYVLSMILSGSIDDENVIMDIINSILSFISRGSWCASGYERINGSCIKISEEIVREEVLSSLQLFDISWILLDSSIRDTSELVGVLSFESFGNVATPVSINFVVTDMTDNKIYEDNFSIIVTTEEIVRWDFVGNGLMNLTEGDYVAIVNTLYNGNVSDEFRQEFRISKDAGFNWYWFLLVIPFVILILIILILKRRRLMKSRALIRRPIENLVNRVSVDASVVKTNQTQVQKSPTTNVVKPVSTQRKTNPVKKILLGPRSIYRKLAQDIQYRYSKNSLSNNQKGAKNEQVKKGTS